MPAENAAIERNFAPDEWTKQNILKMTQQLKQLGCSFEWNRELATCDPKYYKWTQDLFLKLYDAGLVYQKEVNLHYYKSDVLEKFFKAHVNWDPVDQTVLADEQVDENGCSWRSGAKVEKRYLKQWFVRTTKFAKDLLDGLDDSILKDWRDIIKIQQHWIGECNGIVLDFLLSNEGNSLPVWCDRPEYFRHVSFIALRNSHLLSTTNDYTQVDNDTKKLNITARNPLTGEEITIYVTSSLDFAEGSDTYTGKFNL